MLEDMSPTTTTRRCAATTALGLPCQRIAMAGSDRCPTHGVADHRRCIERTANGARCQRPIVAGTDRCITHGVPDDRRCTAANGSRRRCFREVVAPGATGLAGQLCDYHGGDDPAPHHHDDEPDDFRRWLHGAGFDHDRAQLDHGRWAPPDATPMARAFAAVIAHVGGYSPVHHAADLGYGVEVTAAAQVVAGCAANMDHDDQLVQAVALGLLAGLLAGDRGAT